LGDDQITERWTLKDKILLQKADMLKYESQTLIYPQVPSSTLNMLSESERKKPAVEGCGADGPEV